MAIQLFTGKIHLEIFSYLSPDEFLNAEKVCKVWLKTIVIHHMIDDCRIKIGYLMPIESMLLLLKEGLNNSCLNHKRLDTPKGMRKFLRCIYKSQKVYVKYLLGVNSNNSGVDLPYLEHIRLGEKFVKAPKWSWQESWTAQMTMEQFQNELEETTAYSASVDVLNKQIEGLEMLLEKPIISAKGFD